MLLLLLGVFIFFLVIGTPIAFGLGIAGVIGFIVADPDLMRVIPQRMYSGVDSFPLMAVPFFVLAGELMGTSGILRFTRAIRATRFRACSKSALWRREWSRRSSR